MKILHESKNVINPVWKELLYSTIMIKKLKNVLTNIFSHIEGKHGVFITDKRSVSTDNLSAFYCRHHDKIYSEILFRSKRNAEIKA